MSTELWALRLAKGLSCDGVAKAIGCSESKISRLEIGERGLNADDVARSWTVSKRRRNCGMNSSPGSRGRGLKLACDPRKAAGNRKGLIRFERETSALCNYEPILIPGLAQTPDYARTIVEFLMTYQRAVTRSSLLRHDSQQYGNSA